MLKFLGVYALFLLAEMIDLMARFVFSHYSTGAFAFVELPTLPQQMIYAGIAFGISRIL